MLKIIVIFLQMLSKQACLIMFTKNNKYAKYGVTRCVMDEAAKAKLYKRLDKSYEKARRCAYLHKEVGEAIRNRGWFDQEPAESMSLLQKAAATGKWLRNTALVSGIAVGVGAVLSSDNLGNYAMFGAGLGAFTARDTRDRRLGLCFLQYACLSVAVPVWGMAAKIVRERAERQDPRASFTDSHGQTIFPPAASIDIPDFLLKNITPRQP